VRHTLNIDFTLVYHDADDVLCCYNIEPEI
jgi:hypothetical protein